MGTAAEPALETVIPLLSSKDKALRAKALYVFTGLWSAGRAALPMLIQLLDDGEAAIRADALFAIYQVFGDHRLRPEAQGRKALPRFLN